MLLMSIYQGHVGVIDVAPNLVGVVDDHGLEEQWDAEDQGEEQDRRDGQDGLLFGVGVELSHPVLHRVLNGQVALASHEDGDVDRGVEQPGPGLEQEVDEKVDQRDMLIILEKMYGDISK